jgi:hypothetical protein
MRYFSTTSKTRALAATKCRQAAEKTTAFQAKFCQRELPQIDINENEHGGMFHQTVKLAFPVKHTTQSRALASGS